MKNRKHRIPVLVGMLLLLFLGECISTEAAFDTTEETSGRIMTMSMSVPETSLGIELDGQWRVLTRAFWEDASPEEYGMNYETAMQWMEQNYIYLYGSFVEEDTFPHMELLIRKSDAVNVTNLSKYSNRDVRALGKELAEHKEDAKYDIFQSDYKYAFLSYRDSGYLLREYYTVVNGESYTFTFQKMGDFTQKEIVQMQEIMNSAVFTIRADADAVQEGGRHISVFTAVGFALFAFMLWRIFIKKKQDSKEEKFLKEIEELERKCLEDRTKQDRFEQK